MTTAERKLRLAQLLLQTEDEATLQAIEETLESQQQQIGQYWAIIHALDWDNEGNDDAVMAPAIQLLSEQEEDFILDFHDWFAGQLYRLDGEAYANASVEEGEHFSSDLFLYARCAVLANGRMPTTKGSKLTQRPSLRICFLRRCSPFPTWHTSVKPARSCRGRRSIFMRRASTRRAGAIRR